MSILKAGRPPVNKEITLRQLGNQDDTMLMNIKITKSFHKEIKQYALEHDTTIKELIHKSLKEYIKK